MRKITYLFPLLFLFISCASLNETKRQVVVTGFDFTKYTSQNFLFTPETYTGVYESIGLISRS